MLIHHWWFTGRTLGVNISLIRFSWQARLLYSTIYHIHLQHNIMRHNKQSQPSFDYFHVEEKYISDGLKKCLVLGLSGVSHVCLVSWTGLNEIRLNECEIKSTDTCLGSAVCMALLGGLSLCLLFGDICWWSVWLFLFPPNGLLKYLLFCHLEKMRRQECTINKQQRQSPIM